MTDRLYLRPTGFVDGAQAPARNALRLAGGLTWFSAVELITIAGGKRTRTFVPVARLDEFLVPLGAERSAKARSLLAKLTAPRAPIQLGAHTISFDRPQVMGIVNVTPDSFADGGTSGDPLLRARAMFQAGAAVIDVGGESTRPGAKPVAESEEIARIRPLIERLAVDGAPISIDTRKAAVMKAAVAAGASLVNDVSALSWDDRALGVVAARGCPVVLMHHQGAPETMQHDPRYDDVLLDVYDWLEERIETAMLAGIDRANILVDPGIGFGKTLHHNLTILNGLALFHGLGCPIVLGASRKRSIGALSNGAPVEERLGGSIALAMVGAAQGVQLLRVHDVFETVQALRVWGALRDAALTSQ